MNKAINYTIYFLLASAFIMRAPVSWENFKKEGSTIVPAKIYLIDEKNNPTPIVFPAAGKKSAAIFWASWCMPCKLELNRIDKAIKDKVISSDTVFAVSIDSDFSALIKAKEERKYSFKIYHDKDGVLAKNFGVTSTPTSSLINENGKISWQATGVSPTLISRIKNL